MGAWGNMMITVCASADAALLPLQPDERLSCWIARNPVSVEPRDEEREQDYGELELKLPSALKTGLQHAAIAPDAWMLRPQDRTLYCPQCMAGDWAMGRPTYWRRSWTVAWRTCCPCHGMLLDTYRRDARVTFVATLMHRGWQGRELGIWSFGRGRKLYLDLAIGKDHRAVHLERALEVGECAQRDGWFPAGFDGLSLRHAYAAIVRALLEQFYFGHVDDDPEQEATDVATTRQLGAFLWLPNPIRYAINVLAEAVVADWSDTPLPDVARAFRTRLLLHAIGWSREPLPPAAADYVRLCPYIPAPHPRRLANCARHFAQADGQVLLANHPASRQGFTRRQAEAIGANTASFDRLHQLTALGRLGWFEPRRGILQPRVGAVPLSRDEFQGLSDLRLPAWVEQFPQPTRPELRALASQLLLRQRRDEDDDNADALRQ